MKIEKKIVLAIIYFMHVSVIYARVFVYTHEEARRGPCMSSSCLEKWFLTELEAKIVFRHGWLASEHSGSIYFCTPILSCRHT